MENEIEDQPSSLKPFGFEKDDDSEKMIKSQSADNSHMTSPKELQPNDQVENDEKPAEQSDSNSDENDKVSNPDQDVVADQNSGSHPQADEPDKETSQGE